MNAETEKMSKRVLIIEDNAEISDLLTMHLSDADCQIDSTFDGLEGWKKAQNNEYDLIILDLMLPNMDGLQICQKVRSQENYTPILMLTAKTSEIDRVLGLELGADDYLTKPFSIRELLARVKALFRRMDVFSSQHKEKEITLDFDGLHINLEKRTINLENRQLDLTAKEFDLLIYFANHPGRVFTRAQLLDQVWGYGHDGYEHTVNSHINRLRGKIEKNAADPKYIMTVWGVGYKFNPALAAN